MTFTELHKQVSANCNFLIIRIHTVSSAVAGINYLPNPKQSPGRNICRGEIQNIVRQRQTTQNQLVSSRDPDITTLHNFWFTHLMMRLKNLQFKHNTSTAATATFQHLRT